MATMPVPDVSVIGVPGVTAPVVEVLVVSDEVFTRRLLEGRLEQAGHPVRTAASAADARDLIRLSGCPDVLIVDPVLPDGGPELISDLRADPDATGVGVLVLSGRALPAEVDAACALGAHPLPTPVSPDALTEALGAALRTVDAAVEHTVRTRLATFGTLDEFERDLVAELLIAFVQRAPAVQITAEDALATGDAEALQLAVRRLKAAALNLGGSDLAGLCADLDERAGRGEFPLPVPSTAQFRRVLGATCRVFAGLAAELRNLPLDAELVGAAQA